MTTKRFSLQSGPSGAPGGCGWKSVLSDARDRAGGIDAVDATHVTVHRQLPHSALRDLYARARVVVVPLEDVDYDAGVTVITEALAMAKPVSSRDHVAKLT